MGGAEANIEGNQIVIRIDIETLPIAVEGGIDLGTIASGGRVVDAYAFAKEVVYALNDEEEDGTTLVHEMFDAAFDDALDMGAQGVNYDDDLDDGDEGLDYLVGDDEDLEFLEDEDE